MLQHLSLLDRRATRGGQEAISIGIGIGIGIGAGIGPNSNPNLHPNPNPNPGHPLGKQLILLPVPIAILLPILKLAVVRPPRGPSCSYDILPVWLVLARYNIKICILRTQPL